MTADIKIAKQIRFKDNSSPFVKKPGNLDGQKDQGQHRKARCNRSPA
jgi:hypothetical protein